MIEDEASLTFLIAQAVFARAGFGSQRCWTMALERSAIIDLQFGAAV